MEFPKILRGFTTIRQIFAILCYVIGVAVLGSCALMTKPIPPGHYIVQPGDFLEKIAAAYNQNVHELAEWNDIAWPYTLNPGWQIRIDRPANYMSHLKFYESSPGDTWEKIATREGQPVNFLKEWNRKLAPECCTIDPGLKLLVSPPKDFPIPLGGLSASSCPSQKWATVVEGKGLYDVVVRQCGCSQSSVTGMQIRYGTGILQPGQRLCCHCAKP